jgi:Cdc6-like AAA superfamily ATPase
LFDLARYVVVNGRQALNNVPSLNLRKLFTVDRNEIESLRNIKKLIENYIEQKGPSIPLSIAVFGLPGSGKSFGVKELGKGV